MPSTVVLTRCRKITGGRYMMPFVYRDASDQNGSLQPFGDTQKHAVATFLASQIGIPKIETPPRLEG